MTDTKRRALLWVLYCAGFALIPLSVVALLHAADGVPRPAMAILERGDLLLVAASMSAAAFAEHSAVPPGWREVGAELSKWLAFITAVFSAAAYIAELATKEALPQPLALSLLCYSASLVAGLTAILLTGSRR